MKRLFLSSLVVLLVALFGAANARAQNANSSSATAGAASQAPATTKRGPVFRATKDQIKQAQTLLRARGLYAGEPVGKLTDDTRAALRKYQEAEGLKVTGTLNRATLEKMNIVLTERQRAM